MKLRVKGASLRLRLTQGEMQTLAGGGTVEERVPFVSGEFRYRLRRASVAHLEAEYGPRGLEVRVPEELARSWCDTDLVTLTHEQPVPDGTLRITLEKDFACLAPRRGEDESDQFPNPGSPGGCA